MDNRHTIFIKDRINAHLKTHHAAFEHLPSEIHSYEEFINKLPIINGDKINLYLKNLLSNDKVKSCTFATSSGTTGEPKIFVNALWRDKRQETYGKTFKEFIETHVLSQHDVVANLFTAGEFSTLYDGCSRLLEAIGCNILPIGKLHDNASQQKKFLQLMKELKTNVVFGTPLAIMQCLSLSREFAIDLSIQKIIFTGEAFSQSKRELIKQYWPDANIFGLYGQAETGFIGVQTPNCRRNCYHFFQDWYFIECQQGELIVTDLVNQMLPIFRYKVGDRGKICLTDCECGIPLPLIELAGRVDNKFKFASNLICSSEIRRIIHDFYLEEIEFQIQIKAYPDGSDGLAIVVDRDELDLSDFRSHFSTLIKENIDLYEGVARGVAKIELLSKLHFIKSGRQKRPLIIDFRRSL